MEKSEGIKFTVEISGVSSDDDGATIELTPREQLIQRVLTMTDFEITTTLSLIDQLEDIEDLAAVEARKGEPTVTLDELISEVGFTREELMESAKADGLLK
jgi:hypothetical protein